MNMEKGKSKGTCSYMNQEPDDTPESIRIPTKEEKKARRILTKLNLVPMSGFNSVVMRCTDNTLITIKKPDVYRLPNTDTYIFFGVPCAQEPGQQAQEAAARRFKIQEFLQQALGNDCLLYTSRCV